jgi:hypothetical protein
MIRRRGFSPRRRPAVPGGRFPGLISWCGGQQAEGKRQHHQLPVPHDGLLGPDLEVRPAQLVLGRLASLVTGVDVSRAFMQAQVVEFNQGRLTADGAAKSKWWMTEMQKRVVDRCLQLFGGFGYMSEYPIARAYVDARVQTIYGGTTEIMKEIIGRSIAAS